MITFLLSLTGLVLLIFVLSRTSAWLERWWSNSDANKQHRHALGGELIHIGVWVAGIVSSALLSLYLISVISYEAAEHTQIGPAVITMQLVKPRPNTVDYNALLKFWDGAWTLSYETTAHDAPDFFANDIQPETCTSTVIVVEGYKSLAYYAGTISKIGESWVPSGGGYLPLYRPPDLAASLSGIGKDPTQKVRLIIDCVNGTKPRNLSFVPPIMLGSITTWHSVLGRPILAPHRTILVLIIHYPRAY